MENTKEKIMKDRAIKLPNIFITNIGKLFLTTSEVVILITVISIGSEIITNQEIVNRTGISRNTVSKCIKTLEEKGLITFTEHRDKMNYLGKSFCLDGFYKALEGLTEE